MDWGSMAQRNASDHPSISELHEKVARRLQRMPQLTKRHSYERTRSINVIRRLRRVS